jgi:hypothetical protein
MNSYRTIRRYIQCSFSLICETEVQEILLCCEIVEQVLNLNCSFSYLKTRQQNFTAKIILSIFMGLKLDILRLVKNID